MGESSVTRGATKDVENSKNTEWPSINLKTNLQVNRLKEGDLFTMTYCNYVQGIQIQNYFTVAESNAFIAAAESIGFVHQGSLGPAKGEAYRDNERISLSDPVLAQTIWQAGLSECFSGFKIRGKVAVGLNPDIRFYRYGPGQQFGCHIDESVDIGEGKRTYYTLLIYLSGSPGKGKLKSVKGKRSDAFQDPLMGGETVFYGPRNGLVAKVAPAVGMALLHLHGDKCMLHEALPVRKGLKYVLRSDVVFA